MGPVIVWRLGASEPGRKCTTSSSGDARFELRLSGIRFPVRFGVFREEALRSARLQVHVSHVEKTTVVKPGGRCLYSTSNERNRRRAP